jgi:hypothetical protein
MTSLMSSARNDIVPISPLLRVLCLSDSDTRMKWTVAVAKAIESSAVRAPGASATARTGVEVEVASIEDGALPSPRQVEENALVGAHRTVSVDDFDVLLAESFDVIVVNTVGSRLHLLTDGLRRRGEDERRPIVITGYAGVVYEKHVEGALWRSSADIVACNSTSDLERFRRLYARLGLDPDVLVGAGYAVSAETDGGSVTPLRSGGISTITFAVQPDVPRTLVERRYLLERLAGYARTHPERSIVVKLRARPDEATTHHERHHYQAVFERYVVDRPPNLSFEYGMMADVLRRTDLLVTVSSTAAMEAIAAGRRAAIVSDLGVREDLGNHFFAESGLLRSIDELMVDDLPEVDPAWLEANGLGRNDSISNVIDRLARLLAEGPGPVPEAFYSVSRTPYEVARMERLVGPSSVVADASRRSALKHLARRVVDGPLRSAHHRLERWIAS